VNGAEPFVIEPVYATKAPPLATRTPHGQSTADAHAAAATGDAGESGGSRSGGEGAGVRGHTLVPVAVRLRSVTAGGEGGGRGPGGGYLSVFEDGSLGVFLVVLRGVDVVCAAGERGGVAGLCAYARESARACICVNVCVFVCMVCMLARVGGCQRVRACACPYNCVSICMRVCTELSRDTHGLWRPA
jgi:hypothetical protein